MRRPFEPGVRENRGVSACHDLAPAAVSEMTCSCPGCQSEWATVTDTNRPDGTIFWIYDRGTHAIEVATTERATFTKQWQTTAMVGVAKTKAQACMEVRNQHGMSKPLCTPFIGH
jgi:hypothetical protein